MEKRKQIGLSISLPPRRHISSQMFCPPPSSNTSPSARQTDNHQFDFSELDRLNLMGNINGHEVYKVIHRSTGHLYSLKVFKVNGVDDIVRRQIYREMELQQGLDPHPNIVKCHGVLDQNGEIQVLLDFMDGGSLSGKHITDESRLSNIARQILLAVAYLHGQRKVNRNLKPSNLLIDTSQNTVKITDFGVSRIFGQATGRTDFVRTIAYYPPEKISSDQYMGMYDGFAGDIWSFGLSILEVYSGRFPIAVEKQGDWAILIDAIGRPPPPEAPATASTEFRDFIARCLNKEPERRWSAVQLLQHPFILQNQQVNQC